MVVGGASESYSMQLIAIFLFVLCQSVAFAQQTPTIPQITTCPSSTPIFVLHHGSVGEQLQTIEVDSLSKCAEKCAESEECAGIDYNADLATCTLLVPGSSTNTTTMALQKSCVTSIDRVCSSPFVFDMHPQKILVGFAREVVPADSVQQCFDACLSALDTFGFECESVMYYPTDAECILNTEDRLDRPDLFVDETDDRVIYFDNNCAGSQCYAPYITQYIKVSGKQLSNELDHQLSIDFESCQSICTQRLSLSGSDDAFNCKSFMYNIEQNVCILSDERSKPLGRAALVDGHGYDYYEKKCFASPRTCRNTASFSRVAQMILVGFAAFVMENVPSVTMCLDQCTNPPPETGAEFECKSVMYYYNEQECILNAETRDSKPDLFIPEGDEFQVDYFDISCHLRTEQCPTGRTEYLIRTVDSSLSEGESGLHVIESMIGSVSECLTKCFQLAPDKCRSFNYDATSRTCKLIYLDGTVAIRPSASAGVDQYDAHCFIGVNDNCSATDRTVFDRYLHSQQTLVPIIAHTQSMALDGCLELCIADTRCRGVNYNRRNGHCALFDELDGTGHPNGDTDFYRNLCNKRNQLESAPAPTVPSKKFDIDKESGKKPTVDSFRTRFAPPIVVEEVAGQEKSNEELIDAADRQFVISKSVEEKKRKDGDGVQPIPASLQVRPAEPSAVPVMIGAESVLTICNFEGIKFQVKHNTPFTGVVFVKNKYDSCRVEVKDSDSAILVLGFPPDFGNKLVKVSTSDEEDTSKKSTASNGVDDDSTTTVRRRRQSTIDQQLPQSRGVRECGIVDMLNGTYKATVVVQTNNLGIPGLVTSMDRIYEVSCDYSSMLGGKVTAKTGVNVNGPEAALIQPRGKIELGNPVMMQMIRTTRDDDQPVVQAKLGDILELRWEIMALDEMLDFFIRECVAEPGGNEVDAETLQLIEQGCPTPAASHRLITEPIVAVSSKLKTAKLQAFRFDNSQSVRIVCQLEICKGRCNPTSCELRGEMSESFGRRKRAEENDIDNTSFETARYIVPRHSQSTTSLVVLDPMQPEIAQQQNLRFAQPPMTVSRVKVEAVESMSTKGKMCLPKWTFIGVFGIVSTLTMAQATLIAWYLLRRLHNSAKVL